MAVETIDIIVISIGVMAFCLAVVVVVVLSYCGYCGRLCSCERTASRKKSHREPGVTRSHPGQGFRRGSASQLTPLTLDDVLANVHAADQVNAGHARDNVGSHNTSIDFRPPEPIIERIDSMDDDERILDMGMVRIKGQAIRDLKYGDYYEAGDSDADEQDGPTGHNNDSEAGPPLAPRTPDHWTTVKSRVLKPPRSVVLDDIIVTSAEADHGEDHYCRVAGSFRYLAPKRITTLEEIGIGEFGTVSKGIWKKDNGEEVTVALKSLKGTDDSVSAIADKKLIAEGRIMGQFDNKNIVKLFGSVIFCNSVVLVMEYLVEGCLSNYLLRIRPESKDVDSSLPVKLLSIARDVAAGLDYLAGCNFIHRDIAARNILIGENAIAKIGDFGMSRLLADDDYYMSHGGKLPYKWCPPEVINYRKFSLASDIWSFGVLLYEIWTFGRKPYFPWDNEKVLKEVSEGYRMHPPPGTSRQIYSLMMQCWHPDRRKRPNAQSLLRTLEGDASNLLQLDSVARRRLADLPEDAYQLGADPHHSLELYTEITAKYAHVEQDFPIFD